MKGYDLSGCNKGLVIRCTLKVYCNCFYPYKGKNKGKSKRVNKGIGRQ